MSNSIPRFAVVVVTVGGRRRWCAYDHLTKAARFPVNPASQEQAQGLLGVLANEARAKGEPVTVPQNQVGNVRVPAPKKA